jgi:hypothetical protein
MASKWEPLEDGGYIRPNWDGNGMITLHVYHNGEELEQWHSSNTDDIEEISLPPDYRLCRAVPDAGVMPSAEVIEAIAGLIGFACNPNHMDEDSLAMAYTAAKWLEQIGADDATE